jgi:hypothetical protein
MMKTVTSTEGGWLRQVRCMQRDCYALPMRLIPHWVPYLVVLGYVIAGISILVLAMEFGARPANVAVLGMAGLAIANGAARKYYG